MSLFDLIINIIESSIMCYFIYKYFDFKQMEKLWLFILAVFATITAGNYFISESWFGNLFYWLGVHYFVFESFQ